MILHGSTVHPSSLSLCLPVQEVQNVALEKPSFSQTLKEFFAYQLYINFDVEPEQSGAFYSL